MQSREKSLFFSILVSMCSQNFMLSHDEPEKNIITVGLFISQFGTNISKCCFRQNITEFSCPKKVESFKITVFQ